jgi:hypothetical protein
VRAKRRRDLVAQGLGEAEDELLVHYCGRSLGRSPSFTLTVR